MAPTSIKYSLLLLFILLAKINAAPIDTATTNAEEIKEFSVSDNPENSLLATADITDKKTTMGSDTSEIPGDGITSDSENSSTTASQNDEQAEIETSTDISEDLEETNTENIPDEEETESQTEDNLQATESLQDLSETSASQVNNTNEIGSQKTTENLPEISENEIIDEVVLKEKVLSPKEETEVLDQLHDVPNQEISEKLIQVNATNEDLKEEYIPEHSLDDTVYDIETNIVDTDAKIKKLGTENVSQENSTADIKISEEVFETRIDMNTSGEAVTTRYFSSEESNSTELASEELFTLTTIEPNFSEEKLENRKINSSNESSEAIMTKYHDAPSEEAVTTKYISMESQQLESFEDARNKSGEISDLTTREPVFSSESSEHVAVINRKIHKIIHVDNASENDVDATVYEVEGVDQHTDERLHILQAKPEEVIPIHGITSEEAFNMINAPLKAFVSAYGANRRPVVAAGLDDVDGSSMVSSNEEADYNATTEEPSTFDYEDLDVETIRPILEDNHFGEMNIEKESGNPSIDGQILGVMRGMMLNFR